jgi:uncharacterized protein with gpF-like domain
MSDKDLNRLIVAKLKKADTNIEELLKSYEQRLLKAYKASLRNIRAELAEAAAKYGDKAAYSEMMKFQRLDKLEANIKNEIKRLNAISKNTIKAELKEVYQANYYQSAYALESSSSLKLGFGMLDTNVVETSILNPLDRISWENRLKKWNNNMIDKINQDITRGLIQGEGYGKIGARIAKTIGESAGHAIRIARTEGHRVQSAARLKSFAKSQESMDRLGVETIRIWTATLDVRTRDSHAAMDGQSPDEDGYYTLPSGVRTEAPGLSGVAEEDINCRCQERMEVKGYESNVRRDNMTKELIPNMTYQEWYDLRINTVKLDKGGEKVL